MPAACLGHRGVVAVSIRARPGGRAMPTPRAASRTPRSFQSAPGREAGRCARAIPLCSAANGFNPRPAGRPGDAFDNWHRERRHAVSIRARPGGRAMRGKWGLGAGFDSTFQSAPGREAGRCTRFTNTMMIRLAFQSAPGREAGRCSALITDCFDCGTMQACASLLPWASAVGVRLLSPSAKLLKNNGLWRSRNTWHFAVAWGSRFISTGGLRNRPSGRRRTASPSLQPVR